VRSSEVGRDGKRVGGWSAWWVMSVLLSLALAGCGGGWGDGRSGRSTAAAERPTMRILAAGTPPGVMINEVVAGAWQGARDEHGDAEDWVELYNPGDAAMDLTGFGLSNKTTTPFLWVFPAGTTVPPKGYHLVWLSKKDRAVAGQPQHASFNLDSGSDGVFLTASNGTASGVLVDSATPPLLNADHSWCRVPNGALLAAFSVCAQATRGAPNGGPAAPTILATPTLSPAGGFYASAQTVAITGPAGATLRYTTDGSEPVASSPEYSAPLAIAASQVVRAAAFSPTAARSLVATATYVIDAALASRYAGLKAMLVTIAPADLAAFEADDKTRRFRASFEYLAGGALVFRMDGEGVSGGQVGSATSPQRTMNVSGRDAFGAKSFPAVFWPDKPTITSHRKFRLRNGSNDWAAAHLRDQLSQRISADGPNLYAASATVAMFINGRYYAMMDLREREEETLPATNLGIDKDHVDYLTDPLLRNQEIKNGGAAALAAYQALHNQVVNGDMSVAADYARVKLLMNPESLAWDWALHMFHANYDWPDNNIHVWRSPALDGRWQWRPHDMDLAFDAYNAPEANMNVKFGQPGAEVMNALLRNPEFRTLYLNTVADQLNTMTPASMEATLDLMAADMRPYVPDFHAKNNLGNGERWEAALDALRFYFGQREPVYDQHTRSWFGLGPRQPVTVAVNDLAMGSVSVNQVRTERYMTATNPVWKGSYYPGVPVTLVARPRPGFAFVGWQGASTSTARQISQTLAAPAVNGFPADNFSVRWEGSVEAPASGTARLQAVADDGVRVWFDGVLVIDRWIDQVATAHTADVTLVAGRRHSLKVEYYEATGSASVKLNWRLPGGTAFVNVLKERLYPPGAAASPPASGSGLTARYFANRTLSGMPSFERVEGINVDWGTAPPAATSPPLLLTAVFAPSGVPATPVLAAIGPQAWRTGDTVRLVATASDPGQYPVTYTAKSLPKGLSMHPQTGVVYGRLTTPGSYSSTITASNGAATGTQTVNWTVSDRPGSGLLGSSPGWLPPPPPPPNVPPTVSLAAPAANTRFAAGTTIGLNASAADSDGSVARVEFYDGSTLIGSVNTAPFALNWNGAAPGAHSVTARAIDNLGASTTSAAVAVTVDPPGNAAPTVVLTVPPGDTTVVQGNLITVTASAADSDGSIASVVFYDGSTRLATLTRAPYTIAGSNVALGVHLVTAVATDNQGASTRSDPVTITVVAPGAGSGSGTGLRGSYYANNSLSGTPVLVRNEAVNFNWGTGSAAAGLLPADDFSVRWQGRIEAPVSGAYYLQTNSDDGVRVWVNGALVINNWTAHAATLNTSGVLYATAGQRYTIVVEYQEFGGDALLQLRWRPPSAAGFTAVPLDRLYPP
jgi:PA14 domain/CotH kinase protein/Lamin Tail Domain/Bacterial Ig domain/Chitobiase/beta-hexosaminidase C-terminal domain